MEKTEYTNKSLKTNKKEVKKEKSKLSDVDFHNKALEYAHKHNITVKQAKNLLNRD